MNQKKPKRRIFAPCKKCLYKLGLVQCFKNPCPQCKLSGYVTYDFFNNYYPANKNFVYEEDMFSEWLNRNKL
jgi:hypothetical protein